MKNNNTMLSYTVGQQMRMMGQSLRSKVRVWCVDDLNAVSQSMRVEETRLPRLLRLMVLTLSAATGLFILWAALTPVKELARTDGQVLPSGYSQLVQHLEGGLVRQILIHEGDFVQKDQLLVQLDGAGLEEDFKEQQALVDALAMQVERLHALLEVRELNFTGMNLDAAAIAQQKRMFNEMRTTRASERSVLDEQIAQKKIAITRLSQSLNTARSTLGTATEGKNIYAGLSDKGLATRSTYLKRQEEVYARQGDVNSIAKQIEEGQRELIEFAQRREALAGQQRDSAYNELRKAESDLAQARESLKKRNDRVGRLEVRAPVMGYVKGLKLNTIGAVIPAGQTLMEIVPVDEKLIVEAHITPQQIGRVVPGQEVRVKVDSYDYVRYGAIEGTLESISAMTFVDEMKRQDYYKGRVVLKRNYAGATAGSHLILPGMTVDADIVTGEKTVLGYLMKPIQVAVHNAMSEQ
ncbi:MAG: HlyD family type I secretion periplasmic adaptor subunit [Pseudomonadota bacterium]